MRAQSKWGHAHLCSPGGQPITATALDGVGASRPLLLIPVRSHPQVAVGKGPSACDQASAAGHEVGIGRRHQLVGNWLAFSTAAPESAETKQNGPLHLLHCWMDPVPCLETFRLQCLAVSSMTGRSTMSPFYVFVEPAHGSSS